MPDPTLIERAAKVMKSHGWKVTADGRIVSPHSSRDYRPTESLDDASILRDRAIVVCVWNRGIRPSGSSQYVKATSDS